MAERKRLPESEAKEVLYQITQGLNTMHVKKVVHRDLKGENIYMCHKAEPGKYTYKIGDFGFATDSSNGMETTLGTSQFMAPELYKDQPYSQKVDMWALGVMYYHMLFGKFPFVATGNMIKDMQFIKRWRYPK